MQQKTLGFQRRSQVRINDLAAPPERMGVLLFMEPFVTRRRQWRTWTNGGLKTAEKWRFFL